MIVRRINEIQWSVYDGPVRVAIVEYQAPYIRVVKGECNGDAVAKLIDKSIRQEREQQAKRELLRGGI